VRRPILATLLAAALVGACASSSSPSSASPASASPAPGDAGTPFADRLEAEIAVEGSPDWPLIAFDSVWVVAPDLPLIDDSATPNLIRIDPATNEVAATIPLPDDLRLTEPLEGEVRIARTNRGVLVNAHLAAAIAGSCSRCLRDIEIPISVDVKEEALPSVDVASGRPVDRAPEPEVTRLTAHHELDLAPLVADAISLAEPIAPLCEEACPGLCPTCGQRLGPEHVAHDEDEIDPRLAALRAFRAAADEDEAEAADDAEPESR